jgi:hypothetical protein
MANSADFHPSEELLLLLELLEDERLTEQQEQRLAEILREDPHARVYYANYVSLITSLQQEYVTISESPETPQKPDTETSPTPPELEVGCPCGRSEQLPTLETSPASPAMEVGSPVANSGRWQSRRVFRHAAWIFSCLALVVAAVFCFNRFNRPQHGVTPDAPAPVVGEDTVKLTNSQGCRWELGTTFNIGDSRKSGPLRLFAGLAELTFSSGAVVILEGPAELEIISPMHCVLRSGRLVAHVPSRAVGFTVETLGANIRDLGTEFGVAAEGKATTVQVYAGTIVAQGKQDQKNSVNQQVTAGHAIQISATDASNVAPIAFQETRFVRQFPPRETRGSQYEDPYNQSRIETCRILPTRRPIVIDGNLSEWDRSGEFTSRCMEPYSDTYHVRAMLMYDDQNLYIGADVGDPHAMHSAIDPDKEPRFGWRGGGIQVRIATDPALGWPLEASYFRRHPATDGSDNIVHLTMWYYEPRQQPCLHVNYGMNYHGDIVNPAEFRGAYRKHPDGRGYILEYAIPWTALNSGPGHPRPKAGDVTGICLLVHWSEATGAIWRGMLVDVLNPNPVNKGMTSHYAGTWGQALWGPLPSIQPK